MRTQPGESGTGRLEDLMLRSPDQFGIYWSETYTSRVPARWTSRSVVKARW